MSEIFDWGSGSLPKNLEPTEAITEAIEAQISVESFQSFESFESFPVRRDWFHYKPEPLSRIVINTQDYMRNDPARSFQPPAPNAKRQRKTTRKDDIRKDDIRNFFGLP